MDEQQNWDNSYNMSGYLKAALSVLSAALALLVAVGLMKAWKRMAASGLGLPGTRVLLVTAHPDDEAMFFAPTLLWLAAQGVQTYVLCLSLGNAYGQGQQRQAELMAACQVLKVPKANVKVVDDPELPDGMQTQWPAKRVSDHVKHTVQELGISQIITFDDYGVSGHVNHIAVHHGIRSFLHANNKPGRVRVGAWQLESSPLAVKFSGPLAVVPALVSQAMSRGVSPVSKKSDQQLSHISNTSQQLCAINPSPITGLASMSQHESQLVWYRWLFMLLSRYNYLNTLTPLEP